jgi:hypothetical protein
LLAEHPTLKVKIFSGSVAHNVERLLIDPTLPIGTTIEYAEY